VLDFLTLRVCRRWRLDRHVLAEDLPTADGFFFAETQIRRLVACTAGRQKIGKLMGAGATRGADRFMESAAGLSKREKRFHSRGLDWNDRASLETLSISQSTQTPARDCNPGNMLSNPRFVRSCQEPQNGQFGIRSARLHFRPLASPIKSTQPRNRWREIRAPAKNSPATVGHKSRILGRFSTMSKARRS
jgi:hypothetical protein